MVDIKKEVGERLREAREKKNLQQKRVANSLGIHNSTLAKYESGEREADYETLNKLAAIYEVPVGWITGNPDGEDMSHILNKVGDPGSRERSSFTQKFMDEFEQLPQEAQHNLYDLLKLMKKK